MTNDLATIDIPITGAAFVLSSTPWMYELKFEYPGSILQIESPIEIKTAVSDDVRTIKIGDEDDIMYLSGVVGNRRVRVARAFHRTGRLEIILDNDTVLSANASNKFESWNFAGVSGYRIVSGPGAQLTIWQG